MIFYVIINVLSDNYLYICSQKPKHVRIMTTLAQRISETPMAPYAALLRGMTREQKQIVVTYITESMEEPKRQVTEKFKRLRGIGNRDGWEAAAIQAHQDGEDKLMADDVFEDEKMEDWKW